MNNIFKRINFRQPKYMLPAILYIPLLGTSYFIFDLFHTEKAEVQDKTLQTTEFLNPELPDAQIKGGDGIGSKYENMANHGARYKIIPLWTTSSGTNRTITKRNMNRNTPKRISPCLTGRKRRKIWQRKRPMPRGGSRKLSQNWKKHSPKRG